MEIPRALIRAVEGIAADAGEGRNWTPGAPEVNDFSVCFRMLPALAQDPGLYVKIPKHDLCLQDPPVLFPVTPDDRRMGQGEFESLRCLEEVWGIDSDGAAPFVTTIGYVADYNAIVTRRVVGEDAHRMFSVWVASAARGNSDAEERFAGVLRSIARPLASFHDRFGKQAPIDCKKVVRKIDPMFTDLETLGVDRQFLEEARNRLARVAHFEGSSIQTRTLKGLDVRNVLWRPTAGPVLLDPGALKADWAEADLARFLVTVKILYWGSIRFLVGTTPPPSFEAAFLDSYEEIRGPIDSRLLTLLTIKELLKHWRMAYVAVAIKGWPNLFERMVSRWYVDRFYASQVSAHLGALARGARGLSNDPR